MAIATGKLDVWIFYIKRAVYVDKAERTQKDCESSASIPRLVEALIAIWSFSFQEREGRIERILLVCSFRFGSVSISISGESVD